MINGKNFEEELKKIIFDRIYEIQDKNQEIIANTKAMAKTAAINLELSNIARTATNKLITDIVPQFQKAGLKFYSNSVVSRAIYLQIIDYVIKGNDALKKCNDSFKPKKSTQKQEEQDIETNERGVALKKSNAISRFFANLRKGLKKPKIKNSTITHEDIENAKLHISKYEDLDRQLCEYNLRDNIVPALTEVICPDNNFIYLATIVPELVYEDIAPELTKLGLGDLIPQLEEQLVAKYTKCEEGRLENCTTQSEVDLYIPNFDNYRAKRKTGVNPPQEQENKTQASEANNTLNISEIPMEDGIEPGED